MIKFITTLPGSEIPTMGEKLFRSWDEYSSPKMKMIVLLHKKDEIPKQEYKNLEFKHIEDEKYYEFLEKYSHIPECRGRLPNNVYEYRFDAVRFCHKVYAINEGLKYVTDKDELYIWWDSDAFFTSKITPQILKTNLGPFNWLASYLGRKDWDHSETGFIAFNLKNPETKSFIKDFVNIYNSGEIFKAEKGRTDSHIFDLIMDFYSRYKGQIFKNLSKDISGNDVWSKTFLNNFSVHHKGFESKIKNNLISEEYFKNMNNISEENKEHMNKETIRIENQKDIGFMKRYVQLYKFIEAFKFKIITEIGISKGDRAEEMIRTALKNSNKCVYFGFDLFEDLDDETAEKELNKKQISSYNEVYERLRKIQKEHKGFFFALYKGNTRETLPKYADKIIELANDDGIVIAVKPTMSEFVFIDGGHSVETIENDYEHFKNCPLVILDDYYEPDEKGVMPDINKFGCNFLLKKYPHLKVLPIADRIIGGGFVKFVLGGKNAENIIIKTENETKTPENRSIGVVKNDSLSLGKKGIQIQTKNSLPDEEIQKHVEYTCKKMIEYNIPEVQNCHIHDTWAYMIAGAPTYKKLKYMKMIEEAVRDKSKGLVFTSKTAHDYLIENDLTPWACILLDPRPHVIKTFKPHKDVLYLVASQCHPSVIDTLLENNCKIQVYHAAVAAGEDRVVKKYFPNGTMIPGGSTSQTRGISVLMRMGFYRFKLFGLDSSYPSKPDKVHGINQEKSAMEIEVNLKNPDRSLGKFWTDPEMIVQINDLEHILKIYPHLEIDCQSEGIFGALYNEEWKKERMKCNFSEVYKEFLS